MTSAGTAPALDDAWLVEVRLLGVPVRLSARALEHFEELQREFVLIAASDTARGRAPARLLDLVDRAQRQYGAFSQAQEQQLAGAVEAGIGVVDLVFRVPPDVAALSAELRDLLEEVEEHCRSGDLLTLETPADCAAYSRWYLDQFVTQVAGADPVPFDAWRSASG